EVSEDLLGGEASRGSHDASTRVGARTALVVPLDRCPVLVPARGGTEEEHLGEKELAGEDVAFAQTDRPFDVERSYHLTMEDQIVEPGEDLIETILDQVTEVVPFGIPVALLEVIGGVLDET